MENKTAVFPKGTRRFLLHQSSSSNSRATVRSLAQTRSPAMLPTTAPIIAPNNKNNIAINGLPTSSVMVNSIHIRATTTNPPTATPPTNKSRPPNQPTIHVGGGLRLFFGAEFPVNSIWCFGDSGGKLEGIKFYLPRQISRTTRFQKRDQLFVPIFVIVGNSQHRHALARQLPFKFAI